MISVIYNLNVQNNKVSVTAIVEDIVLAYSQTKFDPEEYGPALCNASFELDEGEELPNDEDKLIEYLNDMNLDWEIVSQEEF